MATSASTEKFNDTSSYGTGRIVGESTWVGTGASSPTRVNGEGVATVTRTGTGVYTVTFLEGFKNLHLIVGFTSTTFMRVWVSKPSAVTTAPTCTLSVSDASGTPTDLASTQTVTFLFVGRNSVLDA